MIDSEIGSFVFDPNNEYSGLKFNKDGTHNEYFSRIVTLDNNASTDEGEGIVNFQVNLSDIKADEFCELFTITTPASIGEVH